MYSSHKSRGEPIHAVRIFEELCNDPSARRGQFQTDETEPENGDTGIFAGFIERTLPAGGKVPRRGNFE